MSRDNAQRALVPQLRFPEFRRGSAWHSARLGDFATIVKGKGISKDDITPDGALPAIRYAELYTLYDEVIREVQSRTNLDADGLVLSEQEDVIIPASGETKADIATAASVLIDGVALGSDLNVIRSHLHGPFLSYYLNGSKRADIAKVAQGDVIVHLYPRQLENITVDYPEPAEQRKIAACLDSLDGLLAAETRKLEALREHKKGLMQRLFPCIGETQPRSRFPEFCGMSTWRRRRISDILVKAAIPVAVDPDTMYREIGVRSHGNGIFHKDPVRGESIGGKRVFQVVENALVLNIVFAWEQAVATTSQNEAGMIASHRFPMYVPQSEDCEVSFVKLALLTPQGKHLLGVASPGGAGRNRTLGQGEFEKLELLVPDRVEQSKIASSFLTIDSLIESQAEKLYVLRTHKSGLMQQLFPSPLEAER